MKTRTFRFFGLLWLSTSPLHAALFSDPFNRSDGLITNEFAYWSARHPHAAVSPDWEMTSGSFFASGGQGWSGSPDDKSPNWASSNGNNSAIFRLTTRRSDFEDVAVSFSLRNQGLTQTRATPEVDWDGVHVWLRYQTQYYLYYASINRRDNTVIIKKKIPGGPSNGGTYVELSPSVHYQVPYNTWQKVRATIKTNSDGSVAIALYVNGELLVRATDHGDVGGAPIRTAGKIGIRGDNCNLQIDDVVVESLGAPLLNDISPSAAAVGSGAVMLTVDGKNFERGASVLLNGSPRTTRYENENRLTADVTSSDLASRGTRNIAVRNPDGQTTGAADFAVRLVPAISELRPAQLPADDNGATVSVVGSQFATDSIVRWEGQERPTTYITSTELQVTLRDADLKKQGTRDVTVANKAPGGVSDAAVFTVLKRKEQDRPEPVISGISPTNLVVGGPAFTLRVEGSKFHKESVIYWDGSERPTTYVDATELRAKIPASDIVKRRFSYVRVFTPGPGGGLSKVKTFTIRLVSHLESIKPASVAGGRKVTLELNGEDFVPEAVVQVDGSDRPTTFVNSGKLTATIPSSDTRKAGTLTIRVFNPSPGGYSNVARLYVVSSDVAAERQAAAEKSASRGAPALGSTSVQASSSLSGARAFPNPWRSDRHPTGTITFDRLTPGAVVKIFTVAGQAVRKLSATSGSTSWDLRNDSGDRVGSGLYLYLITNDRGDRARGQLAVIR